MIFHSYVSLPEGIWSYMFMLGYEPWCPYNEFDCSKKLPQKTIHSWVFFWGLPWPFGWLKYPTFYVASYVYPIYPNKLSQKWTNLSLICIYRIIYYPGWWYTYHSEKYELVKVSWDDFPFPTEWKVIIHSCSKAPTSYSVNK